MILDFLDEHIGWVLGGLLVAVAVFLCFVASAMGEQKARFMAECRQDHKEYECTAMWRAGEPDVVPMPIIIR